MLRNTKLENPYTYVQQYKRIEEMKRRGFESKRQRGHLLHTNELVDLDIKKLVLQVYIPN